MLLLEELEELEELEGEMRESVSSLGSSGCKRLELMTASEAGLNYSCRVTSSRLFTQYDTYCSSKRSPLTTRADQILVPVGTEMNGDCAPFTSSIFARQNRHSRQAKSAA